MPCVVPQLKSITLGGAAAASDRGLVIPLRAGARHLLELDVLLAGGSIVTCTPDNEHRDLFYGFPNSYGTLGYALKVTARTVPVKPYVRIEHVRHADPNAYFADSRRAAARKDADSSTARCSPPGRCTSPRAASPIRRPTRATTPMSNLLPLDPRALRGLPHGA